MSLKDTITADLKTAMKGGDKVRVSVLRMLLSEITAGEKAAKAEAAEKCVASYLKKVKQARVEMQADAERSAALDSEIAIVDVYVPKSGVSKEDITAYLKGVDLARPFGQIMADARKVFPTEGKMLSEVVKEMTA